MKRSFMSGAKVTFEIQCRLSLKIDGVALMSNSSRKQEQDRSMATIGAASCRSAPKLSMTGSGSRTLHGG